MSANDAYAILMERLGFPDSTRLRAILEDLMTPEQVRIATELPGTPQEVAKKTGTDVSKVRDTLDDLFYKGVVFPRGDLEKREYFRFARTITQLHDGTQASGKLDLVKDRGFFELWHDFNMNEWYPSRIKELKSVMKPQSRIIPAYKSIQDLADVLPYENFHEVLRAQELIAVAPCSCRYCTTSVGEQCKHTKEQEQWHCLQFGRGAEYVIKRGSGKRLSLNEALELCDKIEEDGLLHMWPNSSTMTGVNASCQCCRDCCMNYVPYDQAGIPIGILYEKSRYQAEVNLDDCTGCQICVDRCLFDTIEMERSEGSKKYKAFINPENCFGCGVCVVGCAAGAIKMKAVRPPEHIPAPRA